MRCIRGSGSTRSSSSGNNFMSRTQQKIPRGGCSTSLSWNYHDHRYHQHLRQQPYQQYHQHSCRLFASVTGTVYTANSNNNSNNANGGKSNGNNNGTAAVVITLYTKEGCTLCDQVKDVLQNQLSHTTHPHTLQQIDITDTDQQYYYDRYKYDIPVLHIGATSTSSRTAEKNTNTDTDTGVYWTKHGLDIEEAQGAIQETRGGTFQPRQGQPNASAMER